LKEAATYVAKPFDYASYGLGRKKEADSEDAKDKVNEEVINNENEDIKDSTKEEEEVKENEGNEGTNTSSECWANSLGYECCKNTCAIYSTDETGQWSIENGKWCGIIESQCQYECFGEVSGRYPCCESCDVVYTDEDGQWGVENNKWCSIKSTC